MPKYSNKFVRPSYVDHKIVNEDNEIVGTIRVKPVSILWKGASKRCFKNMPLADFIKWIDQHGTDSAK